MTQYLKVDNETHRVVATRSYPDQMTIDVLLSEGPEPEQGFTFRIWLKEKFSLRGGPTQQHIPYWYLGDADPIWLDLRTLDQARADKVAELSRDCATYILGGFVSSALGSAYAYPSAILDQHNLNGLVTRSLYPGNPPTWAEKFWCADLEGKWERRDHNSVQLQQVGDEAITRITSAQAKCDSLISLANAATAEQLATLTWDSE